MRTNKRLLKQLIYTFKITLLLFIFSGCNSGDLPKNAATIDLIIDEADAYSALVTGKELLWSKSQIKWKDNNGEIQFKANIDHADLLLIKVSNSYKSLRCYLEAGQNLNVIFKDHKYRITGNSIAARQNRLMMDIEEKRKICFSCPDQCEFTKEGCVHNNFNNIEKLISDFQRTNTDSSAEFVKFIRFDNKYAYLKSQVPDSVLSPLLNQKNKQQVQEIYRTVVDDSGYERAYFSTHYRSLLKKTINNMRFHDSVYNHELTVNPVKNEWMLASGLKSEEMQAYQMAVSLKALFPIDCELNLKKEINKYTGYWQHFLLDDYRLVKYRNFVKHSLDKDAFNSADFILFEDNDQVKKLADYSGKWIFIGIGRSAFGYSPFEALFLDQINSRLPDLQCFCVFLATGYKSVNTYSNIQLMFNTQEQLKKSFRTDYLPYSLLINPEGEIELVNLPSASSGMLEPMLRKLIEESYGVWK